MRGAMCNFVVVRDAAKRDIASNQAKVRQEGNSPSPFVRGEIAAASAAGATRGGDANPRRRCKIVVGARAIASLKTMDRILERQVGAHIPARRSLHGVAGRATDGKFADKRVHAYAGNSLMGWFSPALTTRDTM
jgi:hypothetical protein